MDDREVCAWTVELDLPLEVTGALYGLLSDDERHRLTRFKFERDRRRYIVAHGALRDLLGHYLGIPPTQVRFVTSPFGKPAISPEVGTGLTFNLSHSEGLALIGVAGNADIGVDVENVRVGMDCLEVAHHWFSAAEALELQRMPKGVRRQAFFDLWTRKEAWAKGRGEGLAMPEPIFGSGPEAAWSLFTVRPAPGYIGAVAIRGDGWQLRERRWEAEVPTGNDLVL